MELGYASAQMMDLTYTCPTSEKFNVCAPIVMNLFYSSLHMLQVIYLSYSSSIHHSIFCPIP